MPFCDRYQHGLHAGFFIYELRLEKKARIKKAKEEGQPGPKSRCKLFTSVLKLSENFFLVYPCRKPKFLLSSQLIFSRLSILLQNHMPNIFITH